MFHSTKAMLTGLFIKMVEIEVLVGMVEVYVVVAVWEEEGEDVEEGEGVVGVDDSLEQIEFYYCF